MRLRTTAAVVGTAVLLLTACGPAEKPGTAFAPPTMPPATGAETGAAEFTRYVERHATAEQRTAVLGHVTKVARSVPQGDHRNSYIATDHPRADHATTRAIVHAYVAWAGPRDDAVMLVLYTSGGSVMGAVPLDSWRNP